MFLVIIAQSAATSRAYAVKYQERFVENNDLVGLGAREPRGRASPARSSSTAAPRRPRWSTRRRASTQVAQLTTAAVVAIVLLFLTKPLQYMPNAVLASVVFVIGIKLVDIVAMREICACGATSSASRR